MIVGSGPDLDKYKALAHKLKIDNSVIFTGSVPWGNVPYYYAQADIFATASISETQGLTVIEAMASGLPVIAALDKAFEGVVTDELNGKFFKTKREYKKVLEELLKNPEKLDFMSKQARITADSHSLKYYADQILYVYKTAIKTKEKKSFRNKFLNFFNRQN